jgi:hypothetical protein
MIPNNIDVNTSAKEYENLMRIFSVLIGYFENQVSTYGASRQDNSTLLNNLKEKDYLYRIGLFSEYYNISREDIEALINLPKSQRAEACSEKGVNRFILRTLFDYNRYAECYLLHHFLSQRFEFKNKNLLDFGCLVSDYGFYFGMLNMHVTLCDLEEHVDFAGFRLSRANINNVKYYAPADYMELTKDQDLAIFSEVLEHLTDPYLLLESCVRNNVKYIFTSMYPYGDEQYFNLPGHTKEAKEQAPRCIEMLRKSYQEITLMKRRTVWVKMKEM